MNYNELNPRHRKQAERLAAALFELLTNPTELRMIVELNTYQDDGTPDPLHNYYMIDGAYIDDENAREGCDMVQLPNGFLSVCGLWATNKHHGHDCHDVHPQAVAAWVCQMITRDRVRNVWTESY